jgi:hypothetical protein
MKAVRTGGCLCGAVRYESAGEASFSLKCHCRDCQRSSGTGFVAAMRVPADSFRIIQGTPRRHVSNSDAGNAVSRHFCGDCGSPLYIQVSSRPDIVGLRVGTLDDPSLFRPEAEIFVQSAQPWDRLDPALPHHPTYPPGKTYSGSEKH